MLCVYKIPSNSYSITWRCQRPESSTHTGVLSFDFDPLDL